MRPTVLLSSLNINAILAFENPRLDNLYITSTTPLLTIKELTKHYRVGADVPCGIVVDTLALPSVSIISMFADGYVPSELRVPRNCLI
jgi:hypothetical protein